MRKRIVIRIFVVVVLRRKESSRSGGDESREGLEMRGAAVVVERRGSRQEVQQSKATANSELRQGDSNNKECADTRQIQKSKHR